MNAAAQDGERERPGATVHDQHRALRPPVSM